MPWIKITRRLSSGDVGGAFQPVKRRFSLRGVLVVWLYATGIIMGWDTAALSTTVTIRCPSATDGVHYDPELKNAGSMVCAYVPRGGRVYRYAGGAPASYTYCVLLGGADPAGVNTGLQHCGSHPVEGPNLPATSCDVSASDGGGGTAQWVPWPGNQWQYVLGELIQCPGITTVPGNPNPSPPVPVGASCDIGDVSIDHGSVSPGAFNGNVGRSTVRLTCDQDATVKLDVSPGRVALTNGGTSQLAFDGGSDEITVAAQGHAEVDVGISSTLVGTPPPGEFSGTSVLTATVQ